MLPPVICYTTQHFNLVFLNQQKTMPIMEGWRREPHRSKEKRPWQRGRKRWDTRRPHYQQCLFAAWFLHRQVAYHRNQARLLDVSGCKSLTSGIYSAEAIPMCSNELLNLIAPTGTHTEREMGMVLLRHRGPVYRVRGVHPIHLNSE